MESMPFESAASDAVIAATHPSPDAGGPCATCAFRPGTEANQTAHTLLLAKACVEGVRPFHCHEQPQLCRGFVAAVNLRGAPQTKADKRHAQASAVMVDVLAMAIRVGAEADAMLEQRKK
jgi:hypothetical protein